MFNSSEDVILSISEKTIVEGGNLNIKLVDSSENPLKDKELHVTVFDDNGTEVLKKSGVTSSEGVASIEVKNLSAGNYSINVTFDGEGKYSANSIDGKIEIVGKEISNTNSSSSTTTSNNNAAAQTSENPDDPTDLDGDGRPDIFYSESYSDEYGYVGYYDFRDGYRVTVYEDGGYAVEDSNCYIGWGYL